MFLCYLFNLKKYNKETSTQWFEKKKDKTIILELSRYKIMGFGVLEVEIMTNENACHRSSFGLKIQKKKKNSL